MKDLPIIISPLAEMSPVLRTELQIYLNKLESSMDTPYFDEQASRLIDCIHYLMEEGAGQ